MPDTSYARKVKIKCCICNKESITEMVFGENKKYPDDFSMECPKCGSTEEGALPTQYFDVLERVGND